MLVVISNSFHVFHILFKWIGRLFISKTRLCPLSHFLTILFGAKPAAASVALAIYNFLLFYLLLSSDCSVNHANALFIGQ